MEEIIELDLNKPWPAEKDTLKEYMDELETLRQRKGKKEFITVLT